MMTSDLASYAQPFCDFLTDNPTVFHAVSTVAKDLSASGYTELSEREDWSEILKPSGKYFVRRNGSSIIALSVGAAYTPGKGVAMIAGHIDALTVRLKPISKLPTTEGYVQLGVAPYAGALNSTWWDRDLGIAGRVLVKTQNGVQARLVNLNTPIARIPTLAPHFGAISQGPFNKETQMVPIIGLEGAGVSGERNENGEVVLGGAGSFASTQSPRLVKAIARELDIKDYSTILSWELELFDVQPATLGGLDKELIYGGRIDDKLCSWSAIQALVEADKSTTKDASIINCVALFDDEEIGSLLRQGAKGNFLPGTIERVVNSFKTPSGKSTPHDALGQTYANSYLVSSDVSHATNPNFLNAYQAQHPTHLNTGVAISADANGHTTTDAVSTAFIRRIAKKCGAPLQIFAGRNDVSEGGTVGPMLSSAMGCRAIDMGMVQLSMHSIRATTGALDPGLGVQIFKGFFDHYDSVDAEFRNT